MENIAFEYFYTYSHLQNSVVTPHKHTFFELVYYLKGRGESCAGDTVFTYKEGDIILYPPDTEHNETHKEDTSVICIAFRKEAGEGFSAPRRFYDDGGKILEIIERIRAEIRQHLLGFRQMVECSIGQIFILLGRQDDNSRKNEDILSIVPCIIAENLTFEIDLNSLADLSGYSYHRFRHLFKERFGTSPKQYIQGCRVQKAKEMLRGQDASVSEVALACGFSSFSAFSQIFKKHAGISPSIYMQEHCAGKKEDKEGSAGSKNCLKE